MQPDHDDSLTGDEIRTGNIEGVGIAIGTGASVNIYGDVHYYPIKLRTQLRKQFDGLIETYTALFGGRDEIFKQIGNAVTDDAGSYLVLTAPAGFGKTALIASLVNKTPEAFAYHFFSPIYGDRSLQEITFLRNVVEQMAQWHGQEEEIPDELDELSALYHKFIAEPLDNSRLLVLDGLDEVAQWQLRPYLNRWLPDNLHIIVTIRDTGQDWRTLYGFPRDQINHIPITGLLWEEVAQVLQAAGEQAVRFGHSQELLGEVMRLAAYDRKKPELGADPFYIRILAEDARKGDLTPENIKDQPPGLSGFLDRWWDRISQLLGSRLDPANPPNPILTDLFATLTVTLGPISGADLQALHPDTLRDTVRADHFEEVIKLVQRFVVKSAEGFSLQHPRLRQHMENKLHLASYRERLMAFCAEWPQNQSPYAMRHYPEHLIEAGSTDDLQQLLLDFDWIWAKLQSTDIYLLIIDFDLLALEDKKASLNLVQESLRLSQNVLAQDKDQLPGQLVGRLLSSEEPEIQSLLTQVKSWYGRPWLCPILPNLSQPGGPLRYTLTGHSDSVSSVAVTPDGQQAISGSRNGDLKVWNLASGKLVHNLTGHLSAVWAVAVTADGRQVISGSVDRTLKVWDLATGKLDDTLTGHSDSVNAVAVTPDSRLVISGSGDKSVKIWDLATGKEVHTLTGHSGGIRSVTVTPDGRQAISGSGDRSAKIWDLDTGELVDTLTGHSRSAWGVAVTQDGQHMISGSRNGALKVQDLTTGETVNTLEGHAEWVMAVVVTPDGRRAISASVDRTLRVWNLATGELLDTLTGHSSAVWAVAVTPNGQQVISGSEDRTLKVWDLVTDREVHTLTGHSGNVSGVVVTPDGRQAISGSSDKSVKVWNSYTGKVVHTLSDHLGGVRAVMVTPDGRQVISGSRDGAIKVWNLATGKVVHTLTGHLGRVNALAMIADRRQVISGSGDRVVKVWDLVTGQQVHTLTGHSGNVRVVTVTSDGQQAISGSSDGVLKVWDLAMGELVHTLTGHKGGVNAVAVTPDGHQMISGSEDQTLMVWNLTTGETVNTLTGHEGGVNAVALTPDGCQVISCSEDQTLKAWDLGTGELLDTLIGHLGNVNALAMMADRRQVISASSDRTLKIWQVNDLHPSQWVLVATFTTESHQNCVATAKNHTIVAGGGSGRIHILRLYDSV